MPSQILSPVPVTPPRKNMRATASTDLFSSLNATLASKDNARTTPIRSIREHDWDVPAPPPPSPGRSIAGMTEVALESLVSRWIHESQSNGIAFSRHAWVGPSLREIP
ncbi:hypothetical protein F5B20DRAFT_575704 [Whalleya microplaca]|nr:hypothetical protein F5B20DRAFT_575704 [Whalleya microplaca]